MNLVYAYTPYYTEASSTPPRQIHGIFIHDTETHNWLYPHPEGSWHYEIDRDGTIYQFIADEDIAWHVRACDEHWPKWLPHSRPYPPSPANCHSIGIELVSNATYRAQGVPYTQQQYDALRELIATLANAPGAPQPYPIDTHGRVQRDRTDPVAFDFERAGLTFAPTLDAWRMAPVVSEEDDMATNAELQAQLDQCNGINTELQNQVNALRAEISGLNGINTELNNQVNALREELTVRTAELEACQATARTVTALTYSDGTVQNV